RDIELLVAIMLEGRARFRGAKHIDRTLSEGIGNFVDKRPDQALGITAVVDGQGIEDETEQPRIAQNVDAWTVNGQASLGQHTLDPVAQAMVPSIPQVFFPHTDRRSAVKTKHGAISA